MHASIPMPEAQPQAAGRVALEPCQPVPEHARLVMDWRNDPDTLTMFYHREPKIWELFWPEFRDSYFAVAELPPFFLRVEDERVGFLRFQPVARSPGKSRRTVDVSINIAPTHRGRRLAAAALRAGLDFLRDSDAADAVVAEVRQENAASCRAFLAAGFRELGEATHTVADTGERCLIVRFIYDIVHAK